MKIISAGPAFLDTEIALTANIRHIEDDTVCLLGGYELAKTHTMADYKKSYKKVIVFNQEQIANRTRQFMSFEYFRLLKEADEVWDYDEFNIESLSPIRNDVKLILLKPCKELNAGHAANKDIDVLFYGAMNEHRAHIINQLKSHKVNVVMPNNIWGNQLNPFIARAKICLNIHFYYETALQEQARMIRWISSNANIISEPSRINYMKVNEVPYDSLVEEIICRLK